VLQKNKEFSELLSLVRSAGLIQILKGSMALTFFAPTNRAFSKLPKEFLAQLKNDSAKARRVLLSHMLPDVLCCSAVFPSSNFFMSHLENLDDWMITIDRTKDDDIRYGMATVQSCDQTATNGVMHVLDVFSPAVVSRHTDQPRRRPPQRQRSTWDDIWSMIFD